MTPNMKKEDIRLGQLCGTIVWYNTMQILVVLLSLSVLDFVKIIIKIYYSK